MKRILSSSLTRQQGASAIEYALIAGLIAAILIAAVTVLGGGFEQTFDTIVSCMTGGECGDGG